MKCNNCGTELEEGVTLCPSCGHENAEEKEACCCGCCGDEQEQPETENETCCCGEEHPSDADQEQPENGRKKMSAGKLTAIIVAVIALAAILISVIAYGMKDKEPQAPVDGTKPAVELTTPTDGNPDDYTCKGTYTVTGEEAMKANDVVIATIGDLELTNGQFQVYYWMQVYEYFEYAAQYQVQSNVDLTKPLDKQAHPDGGSWQQYFVKMALQTWQRDQGLCARFEEAGMELDKTYAEALAGLEQMLNDKAVENKFEDALAMVQHDMGEGCTVEDYRYYMEHYYTGYSYYAAQADKITVSDEEAAAYYKEVKEEYEKYGVKEDTKLVDVRHILIMPKDGTKDINGETVYSDEAWAEAEKKANELLEQWKSGEMTEDSFAELAKANSEDPGSKDKGGLYTEVRAGQMVPEFNDWIFDESRKTGDSGVVKTSYGFHVMYYVADQLAWKKFAVMDVESKKQSQIFEKVQEDFPMEVDYSAIVLADIGR